MLKTLRLFVIPLLLIGGASAAQDFVPDELEGWQRWVLKDKAYRGCPFLFDENLDNRAQFLCAWSGRLQLDVTERGASFEQRWTVYEEDQWIVLPGSSAHWPDRVTANGRPAEVVARDGYPAVRLAPGSWRLAGRLAWDERPGLLRIPPESGLVSLIVDGRPVDRPELGRGGVFLGERESQTREADEIQTRVYRLVTDGVPTRLVTRLEIDVSGSVREEAFGPLLPDGFAPLSLQSPLPAKLEADGKLRLQLRPGSWELEIAARGTGAHDVIEAPASGMNLPGEEIWSYLANERLRVTAVEGPPPVDPRQVGVPYMWAELPAYRIGAKAAFPISERSRGDVSPSNELALQRTFWLDFNGDGFVVKDTISGDMRTTWRLDMAQPYTLLSATEYGDNLLITAGEKEGETGIEVRSRTVDVEALGRSEARDSMPATGWDARFAKMTASLNLPPGHKLLAAPGVDRAVGSWMDNWALLDFFLLLIITIAAWRLFNPAAGIIALLALGLSYHEPAAPTWLWLNLLIAVALLRVAPEGRLLRIVRGYQLLSAVVLVVALIPFVANQVRVAIYPQLEPQWPKGLLSAPIAVTEVGPAAIEEKRIRDMADLQRTAPADAARLEVELVAPEFEEIVVLSSPGAIARYAPNAIVQAGPGVPSWRWNNYRLLWSGPVDPDQQVRFVVLPRWAVSALRFIGIGLVLSFAAILAAEIAERRWALPGGLAIGRQAAGTVGAAAISVFLLAASPAADAEIPGADLLRQLEQRLLEPPACVPRCAEIAGASVEIGPASITMELAIHALQTVAVPLPGSQQGWQPLAVVLDGSSDVKLLRADNGTLRVLVPAGRHEVVLTGPLPAADSVEIEFPTPPRVVAVESDGWLVAGIKDRRLVSGSLQLSRLQTDESGETVRWESSRFPPFVRVERIVRMEVDWHVMTSVERIAPLQGALTLEIPLLAGESIVSGEFEVRDEHVVVSMDPSQRSVEWVSTLPLASPMTLRAPEGAPWQDVWKILVGSSWNATFDGIPPSNVDDANEEDRAEVFDPRPGEELVITATRPEAVSGSTLAFDAVDLDVVHGNRSSDVSMTLDYRSTRGAQHVIRLPDKAEITTVAIDGTEQSLRAENGELTLPISPGRHSVRVAWRSINSMGLRTSTPVVALGAPAGNVELSMSRPADRWLLATSGPELGPAVLYWTELAVLLLFAVILGRIGLSPLQTRHWLILGLGFSTFSWGALAVVVTWLLVCGARERFGTSGLNWSSFNGVQVVIALLTVFALFAIVWALPQGLLGTPNMHVVGYESHANLLSWFADRSSDELPRATVITVPLWIYKGVILTWALWLSFALVRWLPWVWQCFSSEGFWRTQGDAG
jgi:hypothetical protein